MQHIMRFGRLFFLLLVFLPIMTGGSVYLYQKYMQTSHEISNLSYNDLIRKESDLFVNYIAHLEQNLGKDFLEVLHTFPEARQEYENALAVLVTNEVKYLYILYLDENNGKLRYLLDTAKDSERAEYGQKFDAESSIWIDALQSKQVQILQQKNLDSLWVSYVMPILVNGEVKAFLGADFSTGAQQRIISASKPLEKLYFYISIFMIIMLLTAYVQLVMYTINRRKGHIDPLTKLYNRQYFLDLIKTLDIAKYQILLIDLDHFKQVNDIYGHDVGDIILESVSQRFLSAIRRDDMLIRYGGEEFLLLLHSSDLDQSAEVSLRIQDVVRSRSFRADKYNIDMTVSIGINPYPHFAKNIDEAIKIADEQLYKAKTLGRDRIEILAESDKTQSRSAKRISDVKSAINEERIRCMYQPIFDSKTLQISKYELLVRMVEDDGTLVFPSDFLPSISYTQTYIKLTKYILESAFKELENSTIELSVNLSLQDIYNTDILNAVLKILQEHHALASRLTFELLETDEIVNFERIQERVEQIKQTGAKIAIDDFGSGYANFKYLIYLGVDILKIDGSLIRNIDTNPNARHIVETIQSFALKMGIKTVAEQVETLEEMQVLQEIEVNYLQGFYLGRARFNIATS